MDACFWISRRLRLSGTGRSLSAGAVIAVCGIALALMIMELTLAVVTGFKHEISRKVMGFDAQISVGTPYDMSRGASVDFLTLTPALEKTLAGFAPDVKPSLAMQLPGIIKTDDDFAGVVYVGHDAAHDDSFERGNIVEGEMPDFLDGDHDNSVVISAYMARNLGLKTGDRIYSCFFVDGRLKTRRHDIAAIYESNLEEYDRSIVYASLHGMQKVAGVDSISGTRIEYSGFELDRLDDLSMDLQGRLGMAAQDGDLPALYPVTNVLQTGAIYFNWLSLLDTNVVVIFVLMMCVALFTIVSSLFLIVLDRVQTIGLLRSLGASRRMISRIFLMLGMRLVVAGMIVGNIAGIGLPMLQSATRFIGLDPEMYYLDHVPVEIDPTAFLLLNVGVLVVALAVLYIPSKSAAKIDPVETMRYD